VSRGKTAIIAGGTGLYMDSLVRGNDFAPFPSTGIRERLEKQADETGVGLNDFIQQLLTDAMGDWCEYCDTLRRLSSDDEPRHLCLK